MGSCAAPSAKGDDKFITTDYLQQCRRDYDDSRDESWQRQVSDDRRRQYDNRRRQFEDRRRQLDDRQRQLDQERRQLEDEEHRMEEDYDR
ncbi:hypothetical protein [Citrobacter freundii]|uniref:hypothetical protein n=1 Tax=Citrobacter freundii TaxID=546 RepID=UPI000AAB18C1|nr:hypothetical protein [Citrobacter freundii]